MFHNSLIRVVGSLWCMTCALLGAWTISARGVAAAETACPTACLTLPRPADELWVVNTRWAGCDTASFNYCKYQDGVWQLSDGRDFRAPEQPPNTTVFFVHGLAVSADEALQEGWQVYYALAKCAAADMPLRFVIYSWPSHIGRRQPLRTARSKHDYADVEGSRLAWLLSQMSEASPATQVSLIGHNSGGRVVAAALESLADRPASGPTLATASQTISRPLRAVLIAAAIDNNGLLPGRLYGRAVSQVEQMLNLFDPCDRVLHWYRFLERGHRGPEAVGYTGLAGCNLSSVDRAKFRQFNAAGYIGQQHFIGAYTNNASLMAQVRAVALFGE